MRKNKYLKICTGGMKSLPPPPTTPVTETTPTQNTEPSAPPPFPGKVPTEQELKDFLNNPLVCNINANGSQKFS